MEETKLTKQDILKVINALKNSSKYDFSQYSEKSFTRRIEKILSDYKLTIEKLIYYISDDKQFREKIVKDITVNTTEFFRAPEMWNDLLKIIPDIFSGEDELKVWHPGCSTGQEVYSMMILLYLTGFFEDLTIFGTDLNEDVLEIAKKGNFKYREYIEYKENFDTFFANFPDTDISFFFHINEKKDIFNAKKFLTDKPVFLKHNLVNDGNIFGNKLHLIMCRNVLIYFNHQLQNKIIRFFYENLYKDGILVIGKHEGIIGEMSYKFKRIGSIYIKRKQEYFII